MTKRAAQREERRDRHERRGRYRKLGYIAISGVIAVLVIISLFLPSLPGRTGRSNLGEGPGEKFASLEPNHLPEGTPYNQYNSVPPTSGPHWGIPAPWGISTAPIPNERQVHNLEHGGVIIQYNSQNAELISQLEAFVKEQTNSPCYLILAPYPDMSYTIAATAWPGIPATPPAKPRYLSGVRDTMEAFDKARLQAFVDFYRNQGPERVDCVP